MVYFIRQGKSGPIKIGKSKTPTKRLSALQTGSPEELTLLYSFPAPSDKRLETALHSEFSSYQLNGEWFDLDFYTQLTPPKRVWKGALSFVHKTGLTLSKCPCQSQNPNSNPVFRTPRDEFLSKQPEFEAPTQYQCLTCLRRGPVGNGMIGAMEGWNRMVLN